MNPIYFGDRQLFTFAVAASDFVMDDMGNAIELTNAAFLQNVRFSYSDEII